MRWSISGMATIICRSGYTGDDLSVPSASIVRSKSNAERQLPQIAFRDIVTAMKP